MSAKPEARSPKPEAAPVTVRQSLSDGPTRSVARTEKTPPGRKPLPAEKRRVQRTVSIGFQEDMALRELAGERSQTVPQVIEAMVRVHLSNIMQYPKF